MKKYTIIHNEKLVLFQELNGATIGTPATNTIFESDSMQTCIDYLISVNIMDFTTPDGVEYRNGIIYVPEPEIAPDPIIPEKIDFRGKKYRLYVPYDYIYDNYQKLAILMLAKETTLTDVRINNEGVRMAYMYFDDFETESDKLIIENDPILKAGLCQNF